ncbi:putative transposable element [Trichonephila clavipes]|nr:putative transposable element [Trichonephila clavipes]
MTPKRLYEEIYEATSVHNTLQACQKDTSKKKFNMLFVDRQRTSEANPQEYVETPLHPEKLTVWCALWAGVIIGPYFFKNDEGHNVTVNGDRYRAMITNFFIPELNNHDVQELCFQTRRRNMPHSSCHNRFIGRHVW